MKILSEGQFSYFIDTEGILFVEVGHDSEIKFIELSEK